MTEQSNKVSPKPFIRKSEIMDNNIKFSSVSKSGSSRHKMKTEIPHNSKISAGVLARDAAPKTYFGECYEDQQVKLKLLELTPRNPAKETSEGVQEFIKQVSNFIEKKNPFKKRVMHSFGRLGRNVEMSTTVDPVTFNMTNESLLNNQKSHALRQETFDRSNEVTSEDEKNYLEKLIWEKSNSAVSSKRNSERFLQGKKSRSGISVRKRNQKEPSPKNKKNVELKRVITLNENPIFYYENERRNHASNGSEKKSGETSTNKQNQSKKKKHSEIPLRKNRKPVSMLLQKPLEDVESTFSIDLFSKKKPFSPIEELSLCSEIQVIISAVGSSEKLLESGKTNDCEPVKKKISEEYPFGKIQLNRCVKSSDITIDSDSKLSDDLSSVDKKVKVLDIEKVKTASFTVLRSNTNVLSRLESLHKRNISAKEEKIAAKTTSKLKVLNPRNSSSSENEKTPKKYLSFRPSSKGNKLNLKVKERKSKKETEETYHSLKKRSRTKNEARETLATGNVCRISRVCEFANSQNENLKANQNKVRTNRESDSNIPITIRKSVGKSIPKRTTKIQKEKQELKMYLNPAPVLPKTKTEDYLQKSEKLEPVKNSACNKKAEKASHRNENFDEKKNELILGLKFRRTTPRTPPPTPDFCHSISETSGFENPQLEEDKISSKTIILDNKFNRDNNSWCVSEAETRKKPTKTKSNIEKVECKLKESAEAAKIKKLGLVIKGRSLNFGRDEPPEKPESSDSSKVRMQLKIDLNSQNETKTPEENIKIPEAFDWLFMNHKKCNGELVRQRANWDDLANEDAKESIDSMDKNIRNKTFDSVLRKPRKCCASLKRRTQHKTSSVSIKGVRKKKVRSDTEDRIKSDLSFENKVKVDTKLKGDLKEEDLRDLFEDVAFVKLRRRNSEPHSFKEFVWKRTDFGNPKGLRPSVSSLASSLRHLNADDIDDFIFWEPLPQKMTSCWETSLYHFKKPWTVLSCSIFKDNRQSKTPGLILENLRNGGYLNTRQSAISRNERMTCHKENPFDVEPSIAQKNIDIRNWLAALNFPTPPSTSNDFISEGHFSMQSIIDVHNLNKNETCTKRRKILPNIKFSDEGSDKEIESKEKYKTSANWKADEVGHLMELIRRKSGGFVTKEQFLNSDHSVPCSKVAENFYVYSKSAEEKPERTNDGNAIASEPKTLKNLEAPPRSGVLAPKAITGTYSVRRNQSVETEEVKEEPSGAIQEKKELYRKRCLRLNLKSLASEAKVWKFLFTFILIIAIVHYSFLSSSDN